MCIVEKLKIFLKKEINVFFTDNGTTMISHRKRPDGYYIIRLHNMFTEAGEDVIKAVSDYIKGSRRDSIGIIRRFINENSNKIKQPGRKRNVRSAGHCYTAGKFFDLKEIFDNLNKEYFNGTISTAITWGRNIRNGRRYIRFGSYTEKGRQEQGDGEYKDIIRIHPILDQEFIPGFFIESIVYHEMIHKLVKTRIDNGRRKIHTPEFKEIEKKFKDYEKAREWEKENMRRLLKRTII